MIVAVVNITLLQRLEVVLYRQHSQCMKAYSIDLRRFVRRSVSKSETARRFGLTTLTYKSRKT